MEVSEKLPKKLQVIACHVYLPSTHTIVVHKFRYQIFCARRGEVDSTSSLHILPLNYQTVIWFSAFSICPKANTLWLATDEDSRSG